MSKEEGKDQESSTTTDPIWESDKIIRKHHSQEGQEVSSFPAVDQYSLQGTY